MTVTIESNIASLKAQTRLADASGQLGNTYEKIMYGCMLNKASNKAKGLIIANDLKAKTRIATLAVGDSNQDICTIRIENAVFGQIGSVLSRLAELAEQLASSTNVAIVDLKVAQENFASAGSRTKDVDVASKAAELTSLSISQERDTFFASQLDPQDSLAVSLLG